MELICPAGNSAAFREAVEAGADAVYCGFRNETNARNFPGLNFTREELAASMRLARPRGVKTFVAINTFMRAGSEQLWYDALDAAAALGVDAVILADIGLMAYAAARHPDLRIHVSVQAGASNAEAIELLVRTFDVRRVVLPRVLALPEVTKLARAAACETEVFVFGGMCVMAEGRCSLSSYATSLSPNMNGVCSPASHVRYVKDGQAMVSELGGFAIDRFEPGQPAGYPTLCKGRFKAGSREGHLFEEPVSLDALEHLDALREAGVKALKIEGRQRGKAYVATVVAAIRRALDMPAERRQELLGGLRSLSEGQRTTTGAYEKRWR